MKRRDAIKRLGIAATAVALPAHAQSGARTLVFGQSAAFSGPAAQLGIQNVNFGPRDHVASAFVDLSMLTEDGKVRR